MSPHETGSDTAGIEVTIENLPLLVRQMHMAKRAIGELDSDIDERLARAAGITAVHGQDSSLLTDGARQEIVDTVVDISVRQQERAGLRSDALVSRLGLSTLSTQFSGRQLRVKSVDDEPIISRAEMSGEAGGLYTSNGVGVTEATGMTRRPYVQGLHLVLHGTEGRFLNRRFVQYIAPLLNDETLEPAVTIELVEEEPRRRLFGFGQ